MPPTSSRRDSDFLTASFVCRSGSRRLFCGRRVLGKAVLVPVQIPEATIGKACYCTAPFSCSILMLLGRDRGPHNQGFGSGSAWVRIVFESSTRIRIRAKSCIRIKIQELLRLKTESWSSVDAQNGGLEGLWAWVGKSRPNT